MSQPSILSENQKKLLDLLSKEQSICANFYLTGGTALAEFYLHHRLSEDLDFFSEHEFDPQSISVVLKKNQKATFTYFPFTRIEQKEKIGELFIDSLIDIAVNKIFTIYQKPRSRDFIDLYLILTHSPELTIDSLIEKAQIKFDHYIDPVQLGAQYMKAKELKDYPRMLEKFDESMWQNFFIKEAEKLSEKVFE